MKAFRTFTLSARVANHRTGFSSSRPLAELAVHIIKNVTTEGKLWADLPKQ